jgi:hypothetical protein
MNKMPESLENKFARADITKADFAISKEAAILDTQGNGNMAENLRVFETPEGIKVYAGTDRGIGNKENQDRVVVNPQVSQFAVLDGMKDSRPAQILAEKIYAFPGDLRKSIREAALELQQRRINQGTCMLVAELKPGKKLSVSQFGDSGALVFDIQGKIKLSATHEVKTHTDVLEVDDLKEFGIERTSQKLLTITPKSFFSAYDDSDPYKYEDVQLEEGDTVLLFSDALWSNFSMGEISDLVMENKNFEDLFKTISETLMKKMYAEENIMSGYKEGDILNLEQRLQYYYGGECVPQKDNQSLVIFKV